jgi:hypothetical protein
MLLYQITFDKVFTKRNDLVKALLHFGYTSVSVIIDFSLPGQAILDFKDINTVGTVPTLLLQHISTQPALSSYPIGQDWEDNFCRIPYSILKILHSISTDRTRDGFEEGVLEAEHYLFKLLLSEFENPLSCDSKAHTLLHLQLSRVAILWKHCQSRWTWLRWLC